MKVYLIAGEASGDLHASNLAKELKAQQPDVEMRGWGGDMMADAHVDIVKHYRDLAFMGFIEVVMNLRTIARNLRSCKADIEAFKPDAVILIDYPGFNLRIATWCRENNIPVLYYISPQVWAWKQGRVKRIKADVTKMYTILPFEKEFYKQFGMDVDFVGNPLLDVIDRKNENKITNTPPLVALLPGSRKQEIKTMLPQMLEVVNELKLDYVIAGAPGQDKTFYMSIAGVDADKLAFGKTYEIFAKADVGLITSGTATLEAALFGLPQVVCYRGSAISYQIAKRLVKIKYISLVNLIMDREVVTELIQNDFNKKTTSKKLKQLLNDDQVRAAMFDDYRALKEKLGGAGASKRTATAMLTTIREEMRKRS